MGYPHPSYLVRHLSSYQITEWMAYARLEPFGPQAEEMRIGIGISSIISLFTKKGSQSPDPRKFTLSCQPKPSSKPDPGLMQDLKNIFKNAIPRSEWSRKKKRRKTKKEMKS